MSKTRYLYLVHPGLKAKDLPVLAYLKEHCSESGFTLTEFTNVCSHQRVQTGNCSVSPGADRAKLRYYYQAGFLIRSVPPGKDWSFYYLGEDRPFPLSAVLSELSRKKEEAEPELSAEQDAEINRILARTGD